MSSLSDDTDVRERLVAAFSSQLRVPAWLDQQSHREPGIESSLWQERQEELEAHNRLFRVDKVLNALGWGVEPSSNEQEWERRIQNLSIEVPLRPSSERYKKRLDYFGFDAADRRPLLVVETKGPDLKIASSGSVVHPKEHPWRRHLVAATHSTTHGRKGRANRAPSAWADAVRQLSDYVRHIIKAQGVAPQRVLLTNSEWYVVFADPGRALAPPDGEDASDAGIVVFESQDTVLLHLRTFRNLVDYRAQCSTLPAIPVAQARSRVDPNRIAAVIQGLQVLRAEDAKWKRRVPRLEVRPMLLLLGECGRTIAVYGSSEFRELPFHDDASLPSHLERVAQDAMTLRQEAELFLSVRLPLPSSLGQFIHGGRRVANWFPVTRVAPDPSSPGTCRFYVLTGDRSHFIDPVTDYDGCAGHTFAQLSSQTKAALGAPIVAPSVKHRSFFPDGSTLHCMHLDLHAGRRSPVPGSPEEIGDRDDGDKLADQFCFMLPIDGHFCCRSCCFREVCLGSDVLRGVATMCQLVPLTLGGQAVAAR